MKKILLINTNTGKAPYPVPPIGLSQVASNLDKKYNIKMYDGNFDKGQQLPNILKNYKPDYICLSIRNIDDIIISSPRLFVNDILELFIKPIQTINKPIILGGSGFSIFPIELMNLYNADYGIIGEGEETIIKLINSLENGISPKKIPGIISKKNLKFIKPEIPLNDELKIGFSNIEKYIDFTPYRNSSSYPILTKRGCIHKCIYCTYPVIEGNKYRRRNVIDIVDEIEHVMKNLGDISFEFVDSTFNDPLGHAEEICKEIIRRKLKVKFRTMGVNPGNVTVELLELMREAGFTQIDCTPDTASPAILKSYKKNFNREKLEKAAEIISRVNIPTMWFFILGGPGESEKTILETFDFIDKCIQEEDMALITEGLRIYPNTELFNIAVNEGIIKRRDSLLEPLFYISENLTKEELCNIINREISKRPNCLLSSESTPPRKMMKKAIQIREKEKLTEPMFRTLLKIRKENFDEFVAVKKNINIQQLIAK